MARTDEGEFELVLGNRQLISVFLIVVILLAVFFSMGYIVGRNSGPVSADARGTVPAKPIVVEPSTRRDAEQTAAAASQPAAVAATPAPVPAPEDKPAAAGPERKSEAPSARATTAAVDQPVPGHYWQVVSTSRPEAEIISEAIAKKGLKAIVAPAPKDGYFRVLVGPLGDAADTAKVRNDLESAGFKNPILQRY